MPVSNVITEYRMIDTDNTISSKFQNFIKLSTNFYRAMLGQSAIMRLHVVCPSVCPSVCNDQVP